MRLIACTMVLIAFDCQCFTFLSFYQCTTFLYQCTMLLIAFDSTLHSFLCQQCTAFF